MNYQSIDKTQFRQKRQYDLTTNIGTIIATNDRLTENKTIKHETNKKQKPAQ